MINLTAAKLLTAKLLLFVALTLGPKGSMHEILITSPNLSYVWTQDANGWNLVEKAIPTHDWPADGLDMSAAELADIGKDNIQSVRNIAHHDWTNDSVLILDNGDRVEKHGTKVFYTFRSGDYNKKTYTILYIENGTPL